MKYRGQRKYNALTAHSILSETRMKRQSVDQYLQSQSSHYVSEENVPCAPVSMSYSSCLSSPGLKSENNIYIV